MFTKERINFQDIEIDSILYGKIFNDEYGFVEIIDKNKLVVKMTGYILQPNKIRKMKLEVPYDIWDNPWIEWGYLEKSTKTKLAKKLLMFPVYESDARSIL
jgi:starvation-inducible outer membrane lipoprotein